MPKLAIEYLYVTKQKFGDKTAIVDKHGSITFSDLWHQALLLGKQIYNRFGCNNTPVVVNAEKGIMAIVALVAVQLSGNIYVPFDPVTPKQRRNKILHELGDHHIIDVSAQGYLLDDVLYQADSGQNSNLMQNLEVEALALLENRKSLDPLYIIFTSGTTGTPKGVTIANASVIDYIDWAIETYAISEKEIIANQAPLYFDNSVLDLYLTFARGCTLHLLAPESFMFPTEVLDYIKQHSINFIFFVPSVLVNIARLDLLKDYQKDEQLEHLAKILFAGEPMPLNTLRYLRQHFPNALLSNLYGPTEITVDAIYWIFPSELAKINSVPLGIACKNTEILLLDENETPVREPDTVAEICIGGTGVALGYWNNTEKTREVFIQHPEHSDPSDIVYKTGDLGYLSGKDGLIYMTGRKDNQIKHQGYRIELGEIENAMNNMELIQQSCVEYNEVKQEIVAFYAAQWEVSVPDLRAQLAEQLPAYMIPRRYIRLPVIPLTANGKIDRRQIRQDYQL